MVVFDAKPGAVLLEEECLHIGFKGDVDGFLKDRVMSAENPAIRRIHHIRALCRDALELGDPVQGFSQLKNKQVILIGAVVCGLANSPGDIGGNPIPIPLLYDLLGVACMLNHLSSLPQHAVAIALVAFVFVKQICISVHGKVLKSQVDKFFPDPEGSQFYENAEFPQGPLSLHRCPRLSLHINHRVIPHEILEVGDGVDHLLMAIGRVVVIRDHQHRRLTIDGVVFTRVLNTELRACVGRGVVQQQPYGRKREIDHVDDRLNCLLADHVG